MAHRGQVLQNPASGERITFRETAAQTGGELLAIDLALSVREFEQEVQAVFPPLWLQRLVLAPLAWIARRREPRLRDHRPVAQPPPVG
ncbi:MAG: hypothetical protein H0T69_00570 [Thermoleophilaceae bacterium]|nr:hypothetical protein [Thermoleophilaceae bacterium]